MAKKVTAIPPRISKFTAAPINSTAKRKVAGYARVSTDHEDQASSYEAQVSYYTEYIKSREDWEFAGMYSDEGITATSTRKRAGFNQMIEDALNGKIQLIITKSVSRFARNTVDSLTTIRKLKDNGIEVYFEKESIWTLDAKGELLLTIMSSLAQEEARNISENTTWGKRKRFADGRYSLNYGRFLGYDKKPGGGLVVNPEEAETVKDIYSMYISGLSTVTIAKKLQEKGARAPAGGKWYANTVKNILSNEKYKGDVLLQKYYTSSYLTKKQKHNNGEVQQYYIEDDHEAIIPPHVFELVQSEIARRTKGKIRYSGTDIFASKIRCGECGSWYGAKVWHSNDKYRKVVYRCNHKYDNGMVCDTPTFSEEELKTLFVDAFNKQFDIMPEVISNIKILAEMAGETDELNKEKRKLEKELVMLAGKINDMIAENAHHALDQTEYQIRYNETVDMYNAIDTRLKEVCERIESGQAHAQVLRYELDVLEKIDTPLTEFDANIWGACIAQVTVHSKEDVEFIWKHELERIDEIASGD